MSQEIKCSVESCKFNNAHGKCGLNKIEVGAEGNAITEKETLCASFSKK